MDLWWTVNETWFFAELVFAELPKISLHMSCHMK